ncbi:MAG: Hsp20/alpha crystallin family protein [Halovenus sp.]
MTSPTNPFNEFRRLFEQMQENFEEIARSWDEEAFEMTPAVSSSVDVDLQDRGEELVLTAELPGFDSDDIDVRVTDRKLRLEAEHEEESEAEAEGEYVRRERRRASVARSIPLPEAVETADIEATHTNGVLTVRMPKSEPATRGTEIDIN